MDDKLQDIVLDELKLMREKIDGLNEALKMHQIQSNEKYLVLQNKMIMISFAIGLTGGEVKNLIEKVMGM